jgi:CRISPR/Cas system CSM-associated protein Csm2 small subunit
MVPNKVSFACISSDMINAIETNALRKQSTDMVEKNFNDAVVKVKMEAINKIETTIDQSNAESCFFQPIVTKKAQICKLLNKKRNLSNEELEDKICRLELELKKSKRKIKYTSEMVRFHVSSISESIGICKKNLRKLEIIHSFLQKVERSFWDDSDDKRPNLTSTAANGYNISENKVILD